MKIIYVNNNPSLQEGFENSFPKHQVTVFTELLQAYQWMSNDNIPDILVTEIDSKIDPSVNLLSVIRSNKAYSKTIVVGYTNCPNRSNDNHFFHESLLDVVDTQNVTTTVSQIIQLFAQRLASNSFSSLYTRRRLIAKRLLDISIASTGILLASPVFLAAAAVIRLESKGPIFYRSKRVGSNYKIFDLLKFRTMIPDADKSIGNMSHLNLYGADKSIAIPTECPDCKKNGEACSPMMYADNKQICENFYFFLQEFEKSGIFFKAKDDPRISKVGKFLRNSSIDELPQLINILKGDMSLVGNRPLPLYEAEKLTTDNRAFRFLAPAGLTGLWQVTKRGKKDMSEEERINLDNNYALNHSFWLDIKIILKTFPALLQSENV